MIPANELRKGNILKFQDGFGGWRYLIVHEIHANKVAMNEPTPIQFDPEEATGQGFMALSGCYPIELTPEILNKCGFKLVEHPTSVDRDGYIISGYDHHEDELENYCFPFVNDEILNGHNPIKHLHIFQNWYFFSTGKELEIKL